MLTEASSMSSHHTKLLLTLLLALFTTIHDYPQFRNVKTEVTDEKPHTAFRLGCLSFQSLYDRRWK